MSTRKAQLLIKVDKDKLTNDINLQDRRRRFIHKGKGVHSQEYNEALERYKKHPLSVVQTQLLIESYGGTGPRFLLQPARDLCLQNPSLDPPDRLSQRKELALLAWFSMNWDKIGNIIINNRKPENKKKDKLIDDLMKELETDNVFDGIEPSNN